MKRYNTVIGAVVVLLSVLVSACTGDLLVPDHEPVENPYREDAKRLVTGLLEHAVDYTSAYQGSTEDPGRVLLEALASYIPEQVDVDIEALNGHLIRVRNRGARKAPQKGFEDPALSPRQNRLVEAALKAASRAESPRQLRNRLERVERTAAEALNEADLQPVLIATAFLEANFTMFTDDANRSRLNRLTWNLRQFKAPASEAPRFLNIQDATTPRPPPIWGNYYNPGTWWEQTLSDTRDAAAGWAAFGAGLGCGAGMLLTANPAGCGPGIPVGGAIGGAFGFVFGGLSSAIINYLEARSNFEAAVTEWCQYQKRLPEALRDRDYEMTCDTDNQQ